MIGSEGFLPAIRREPRELQCLRVLSLRVQTAREFAGGAQRVIVLRPEPVLVNFSIVLLPSFDR